MIMAIKIATGSAEVHRCTKLIVFVNSVASYVVTRRYARPFKYSTISDPPSFELPNTLSTKVIGT
jgi:hypothetical protein